MLISQMGAYFYSSKSNKNWCPCLSLKWVPIFIAPNLIKIGVHAYLANGYLNPLPKLNFRKSTKVHIFKLGLSNLERGPK